MGMILYYKKGKFEGNDFDWPLTPKLEGDPHDTQRVNYPACYNEAGNFQRSHFGHYIGQLCEYG